MSAALSSPSASAASQNALFDLSFFDHTTAAAAASSPTATVVTSPSSKRPPPIPSNFRRSISATSPPQPPAQADSLRSALAIQHAHSLLTQLTSSCTSSRRLATLIKAHSASAAKFAADVHKFAAAEYGKLTSDTAASSSYTGTQAVISLAERLNLLSQAHSTFAADINSKCVAPIDATVARANGVTKDVADEMKRIESEQRIAQANIQREADAYKAAVQAMRDADHNSGNAVGGTSLLTRTMKSALSNMKRSDSAAAVRRRTVAAFDAYKLAVETANTTILHHRDVVVPELLDRVQRHEQTRISAVASALLHFTQLNALLTARTSELNEQIAADADAVNAESDMRTLIAKCINEAGSAVAFTPYAVESDNVNIADMRRAMEFAHNTPNSLTPPNAQSPTHGARGGKIFGNTITGAIAAERELSGDESGDGDSDTGTYDVPLIVPTLINSLVRNGGLSCEGIFRLSPSADEVSAVKRSLAAFDYDALNNVTSPHVPAALLKTFLRELLDPIIPSAAYQDAINIGKAASTDDDLTAVMQTLPTPHRRLLYHILTPHHAHHVAAARDDNQNDRKQRRRRLHSRITTINGDRAGDGTQRQQTRHGLHR